MRELIHLRKFSRGPAIRWLLLFAGIGVFWCQVAIAQSNSTLIKVGRYWASANGNGSNYAVNYTGAWFPADFNVIGNTMRWSECITGGDIWLAAKDYNYNGSTISYSLFVPNPPGPLDYDIIVEPLETATRYGYATTQVNDEDVTLDWYTDVNPSMLVGNSDQTVTYATRYQNGVELKRTILAFSNQNHDDYIITDLEFTHNGTQTLNDFRIFAQTRETGTQRANGRNPGPGSGEDWKDQTQWVHYYGARPGDSLRIFYTYMADDPLVAGDMMGGPVISQQGRLIESGFEWLSILHASEAPYIGNKNNSDDDPLQPKVTFSLTTQLLPIGDPAGNPDSQLGSDWRPLLEGTYFADQQMDGIHPGTSHRVNNDELGKADWTAIGAGYAHEAAFPARFVVFGPYTFEPGQSLHIVYASGESGIGLKKMKEVGNKWYDGTLEDPPGIPDARTGYLPSNFAFPADATEMDKKKDRWISTGIDSMHKAVSAAKWNWSHDYMVPKSPPPPSVEIDGFGGFAQVTWSDPEAEALPNFAGYRVLRKRSNLDTVFFEVVHTTSPDDKAAEHVFKDENVLFGGSYYYYVQAAVRVAGDDMNALPQNRGKLVYSGRVYNPTTQWINPPRSSQSDLDKIRIVPNPYNINDPLIQTYGWTDQRGIIFFNLPPRVTIKIVTENGDLVQTIEHNSSVLAGSLNWDMLTANQQVISSGIYIVIFEKPNGEVSFQKLAVAR